MKKRKQYPKEFKVRVSLEAMKAQTKPGKEWKELKEKLTKHV